MQLLSQTETAEISRRMPSAPKKTLTRRNAWEDRFRTPTIDDLCEGLQKQFSGLFETAREKLRGYPGLVEGLSWQGLPWRWTLIYRLPQDNGKAWAYLVPDPAKPLIALTVPAPMVGLLPMHRYKKHVKDGVLQSRMVDGVYWATWEITSKAQLGEILELVHHKHGLLTKKT